MAKRGGFQAVCGNMNKFNEAGTENAAPDGGAAEGA